MKVVQINSVCEKGSTGRICASLSRYLTEKGIENHILYSLGNSQMPNAMKISSDKYIKSQALRSRVFGNYGFNSGLATKKIVDFLERVMPDIVHLHNIHGHDCDLGGLFDYLTANDIRVVWTFHDCWAFTGYCTHFLLSGCDKWKTRCESCVQYKKYSMFFDRSKTLFDRKKELLQKADLTIVTPSRWLEGRVELSFLKDRRVEVIPNGIDRSVFKPVESDFREKYGIAPGIKIALGVSFNWGSAKGLDIFTGLSKNLDHDIYRIVLVGVSDHVKKSIPESVITVPRVDDVTELVKIYSAADVFVNPSRADTFPTVNMEALACGLPVIALDRGGNTEVISDKTGIAVQSDDVNEFKTAVEDICEKGITDREACVESASAFDFANQLDSYYSLYRELIGK